MWPFKCSHPFEYLQTEKEQTITVVDADFEHVEYHFKCSNCGQELVKIHARMTGGFEAFKQRLKENLK